MSNKISIETNRQLLSRRNKTILQKGEAFSLSAEQALIQDKRGAQQFMGVIPLRCQLGAYYYLSLADDHVADYLFWLGSFGYERSSAAIFTYLSMQASYVLDLGSYTGYFSILSSVLAGQSNVYAVEANPLNFHRLCENLRVNGSQAIPLNYALIPADDTRNSIEIFYDSKLRVLDTGSFASHASAELISQKKAKKDSFMVQTTCFRELVEKLGIPSKMNQSDDSYVLLKLDVEGLELPLLFDIIDYYGGRNFVVLFEVLTSKTYDLAFSLLDSSPMLGLAYIDEYNQRVSLCKSPVSPRVSGSRNFLFGDAQVISGICQMSPQEILSQYE